MNARVRTVAGSHEEKGNGALSVGGAFGHSRARDWWYRPTATEAPLALIKHFGTPSRRRRSRVSSLARDSFANRICFREFREKLREREREPTSPTGKFNCGTIEQPISDVLRLGRGANLWKQLHWRSISENRFLLLELSKYESLPSPSTLDVAVVRSRQ